MRNTYVKIILAVWLLMVVSVAVSSLAGCSDRETSLPVVKLSIWWSDEGDWNLIEETIAAFQEEHADEAVFEISFFKEDVLTSKETMLSNPAAAADIYVFADDQFEALRQEEALLEITEDTEEIIAANGGADNGACRAAMYDGKLYAYPLTAGNGYFLYYNAAYFTKKDIKSLDRILEVCAENGKKTAIDFSSGWYMYSFFKGAGLELGLNEDGLTNYCNWNASDTKYTGVDVAEAMLHIAGHEGFVSCGDQGFLDGVRNGTIIAGINGAWNAENVREAWGEYYAAAMLPCYTLAGDSVQMCSFSGYKMIGINPHTESAYWAMKLAERLSNEETQIKRFEAIGECPSNIKACTSEMVRRSPAVAALSAQSQYAYAQRIADTYWNPAYIFGITIAGGNSDNQDLQTLLDTMVERIVAKPDKSGIN